jgi:signal transduction histidine kinase
MARRNRSRIVMWLAAGMCASLCVLTWYAYRATRQWQRSSQMLALQQAGQTADLLATALTRDMRAVQRLVLPSEDWNQFLQNPPYDLKKAVASAFARYPYPEAFFAARADLTTNGLLFFTRSNRPPPWAPPHFNSEPFPVTELADPEIAAMLVSRIEADVESRRRFAIFGITAAGAPYQVVVHLRYRGALDHRLAAVFGFMVNLTWARDHYFQELTDQVARITGTGSLALAVIDDRGRRVASTQSGPWARQASRPFTVAFFDPLLVSAAQPMDLVPPEWSVQVGGTTTPSLLDAIQGADRTLVLATFAAFSLAFGMVMTARAMSARERLSELRSEFVSTLTHDLKTPIASIRALGDTLVSGRIPSKDGQREYAQLVVQEAKRLTRLIDNLLALSRITDVTDVYWFEPLAVDALVARTLDEFGVQMRTAQFDTRVDVPADLPPVRADRTAMGLLLDNLVDNAIRYSPSARSLTISAERRNGHVVVNVADRGRGIPPDEIDQVTRKFFRGRDSRSRGSGLGLAIVKRIVTDHHGMLEIASVPGEGTTVSVSLPVANGNEQTDSHR